MRLQYWDESQAHQHDISSTRRRVQAREIDTNISSSSIGSDLRDRHSSWGSAVGITWRAYAESCVQLLTSSTRNHLSRRTLCVKSASAMSVRPARPSARRDWMEWSSAETVEHVDSWLVG